MNLTATSLAQMIDHTILKPDTDYAAVDKITNEAKQYGFATVCVNPYFVSRVALKLKNTNIGITSVIGFPLGATYSSIKAEEAKTAVSNGATEIDMVINIGALKSSDLTVVMNDIKAVRNAVPNVVLKVIIESGLLTDTEVKAACTISMEAGANFVKTSTGFAGIGATPEAVKIMKSVVGNKLEVKASGGIRTLNDAQKYIDLGVTRLGCSSSVNIIKELLGENTDNSNNQGY